LFKAFENKSEGKMKRIILLLICMSAFSILIIAQEDQDTAKSYERWEDWEEDVDFDFDTDFISMKKGKPAISVNYGLSQLSLKPFTGEFADPSMLEVKLGYITEDSLWRARNIINYKQRFLALSYSSLDIGGTTKAGQIEAENWRIDLSSASGYGYKFGNSAIIPYHSNSLSWSRLSVEDSLTNPDDQALIDRYNESFRFGNTTEAGIQFKIIENIAIDASYQRALIYERHLFWKWAGSYFIEAAGQWALDAFINEIVKSSPYAVPVVNFVLKNALSYGMYELRKDKMNWPFDSASPILQDQFKIGLTFIF
jgi:hypothetical protein